MVLKMVEVLMIASLRFKTAAKISLRATVFVE
jgi:hypothetical protein